MNGLHPEIVIYFGLIFDALDATPFNSTRARPPASGINALIKANRIGFATKYICDAAKPYGAANTFTHNNFLGEI